MLATISALSYCSFVPNENFLPFDLQQAHYQNNHYSACSIDQIIAHAKLPKEELKKIKLSRKNYIIEEFRQGLSRSDIARKYNLSWETVDKTIKEAGISKEEIEQEKKDKINAIIEEYKQGVDKIEIIEKFKISMRTFYSIIKEAGLTRKYTIKNK